MSFALHWSQSVPEKWLRHDSQILSLNPNAHRHLDGKEIVSFQILNRGFKDNDEIECVFHKEHHVL